MSAFEKVSGPPGVKFQTLGDSVAGRIVAVEDYQEKVFGSEELKTYPKTGDPVMGVKITLETNPGDESTRVTLWAHGKNMMQSIAQAFRAAGVSDIRVGDDMAVTWSGMDGRAKAYQSVYDKAPEDEAAA